MLSMTGTMPPTWTSSGGVELREDPDVHLARGADVADEGRLAALEHRRVAGDRPLHLLFEDDVGVLQPALRSRVEGRARDGPVLELSIFIASAGRAGTTPPGAGVPVRGHSATALGVAVVVVVPDSVVPHAASSAAEAAASATVASRRILWRPVDIGAMLRPRRLRGREPAGADSRSAASASARWSIAREVSLLARQDGARLGRRGVAGLGRDELDVESLEAPREGERRDVAVAHRRAVVEAHGRRRRSRSRA